MDFLDPKKRRAHAIRLMVGYVLLGIAILLGTTVLLYQANGFDVRQGKIIQNGLIFVSSRPGGATISLDGQKRETTGARLVLPAGTYKMQLTRQDYRTWQRAVTLEGNSVYRYDYPMLIPTNLNTTRLTDYQAAPTLTMQTPDRRWMLVQQAGRTADFDMYDLSNPKKILSSKKVVALPAALAGDTSAASTITLVEASNDNRHFLLQRTTGDQIQYLLLDRSDPSKSRNLSEEFNLPAGATLALQNKRYDRYFIHDTATSALGTALLSDPATTVPLLQNVLAFKTYGDDTVLFATPRQDDANRVDIKLLQDGKTYTLRAMPVQADGRYLLDLAKYDDSWFIAAGGASENRVYVYKDPAAKLQDKPDDPVVPVDVLKVDQPNYLKFSANTQFIMVQGAPPAGQTGTRFAVYDNLQDRHYVYTMDAAMDAPQIHADWMDGDRIVYVSGGKFLEFDYDGTNRQFLAASLPAGTFFDRDYKYQYALAPNGTLTGLTQTPLLTDNDL